MEEELSFRFSDYSPKALAYLGDAYFETLVREYAVRGGNIDIAAANARAKGCVTAQRQSDAVERLLPLLDACEEAVYRAGRNTKTAHRSKSASALDYRRATGLECVFGYLYLCGREARARALFAQVFENRKEDEKE